MFTWLAKPSKLTGKPENRKTGKVEAEFKVQQPDNITIGDDGNLWVASHKHDPITQTCNDDKKWALSIAV